VIKEEINDKNLKLEDSQNNLSDYISFYKNKIFN